MRTYGVGRERRERERRVSVYEEAQAFALAPVDTFCGKVRWSEDSTGHVVQWQDGV
jgi:hypothetical protein